ncbi:MAG: S46 family peptidase, partial [Calditrichia bacterium]|nr:S46 family peptidase [Calditrichia bacterium]
SPDNVPYEPKIHFQIAKTPLQDEDFTFIMGYPGKTYRNYSTPELLFDIELLENSIKDRLEYIDFFEKASNKSKAIEIKYAGTLKSLYNGLKNYRGKLEGFEKAGVVEIKKAKDSEFEKWAGEKKKRSKKYKGIVKKINTFYEDEYKGFYLKESKLRHLTAYRRGSALLTQAHLIVRAAIERQKPDMERDVLFQDRSLSKLTQMIKLAERRYDLETDKTFTILRLNKITKNGNENTSDFLQKIVDKKGGIETWANEAFNNTKINDAKYRLSLIKKTPEELKKLDDHLLFFAFELEKELSQLRKQKHVIDQKRENLKKIYIKGLLEFNNNHLAPDANSTIRFTSGHVKGYYPQDAMYYKPFTTLKGVIEKDKGEYPFNVPEKLKTLHAKKDFGDYADSRLGDVPACFLNTTNVTGGNSGSPTLNA